MMYTILSIDELQELLQTEEYTFIDPERENTLKSLKRITPGQTEKYSVSLIPN